MVRIPVSTRREGWAEFLGESDVEKYCYLNAPWTATEHDTGRGIFMICERARNDALEVVKVFKVVLRHSKRDGMIEDVEVRWRLSD